MLNAGVALEMSSSKQRTHFSGVMTMLEGIQRTDADNRGTACF